MDPDLLARAKPIFDAAVARSPQVREQVLRGQCGDDDELCALVSKLLSEHDQGLGSFLELPTVQASRSPGSPVKRPEQIDRYRVIQKIGEGGFGDVYEAEQTEPVKRRVALKILKAGMDSRAILARFEAERQALALMDHPNTPSQSRAE